MRPLAAPSLTTTIIVTEGYKHAKCAQESSSLLQAGLTKQTEKQQETKQAHPSTTTPKQHQFHHPTQPRNKINKINKINMTDNRPHVHFPAREMETNNIDPTSSTATTTASDPIEQRQREDAVSPPSPQEEDDNDAIDYYDRHDRIFQPRPIRDHRDQRRPSQSPPGDPRPAAASSGTSNGHNAGNGGSSDNGPSISASQDDDSNCDEPADRGKPSTSHNQRRAKSRSPPPPRSDGRQQHAPKSTEKLLKRKAKEIEETEEIERAHAKGMAKGCRCKMCKYPFWSFDREDDEDEKEGGGQGCGMGLVK